MTEGLQRRLAAILAADVVGYSSLMGADEAGTLAALRQWRAALFGPTVADHHGDIVKNMGDGWLVAFDSAGDAVACAIQVQENLSGHEILKLRIGLHIGDITHVDADIFGDGVNIAARLQEIAEPGAIIISDGPRRSIDGKLAAEFLALGQLALKNIADPVTAYGWNMSEVDNAQSATALPDKPSIAVLPFNNLSGDSEQDYFSDSMAEDLITDLSNISNLSVATRNASFVFKGQMPDAGDVVEKLGVAFILEGSVRKMGERLRINAQLIDAATQQHVWAERFDGYLSEIFEFQDRITMEIVSALELQFAPTTSSQGGGKRTRNVEAYDLYLKGRMLYFRYTADDNLHSRACLEKAIALDGNFAEAHSYLSCCYTNAWLFLWPGFDEGLERGLEWARKGTELDPKSAVALTRLAWVKVFFRELGEANAIFEKAISLDPENAEVRAYYAETLNFSGDPGAAIKHLEIAFRLDSLAPPSWLFMLGHSNYLLGRHDDAITLMRQAVERIPGLQLAQLLLACLYVETGQADDAAEQVRIVLDATPQYTVRDADRIYPYLDDAVRTRFLDGLRRAGVPE